MTAQRSFSENKHTFMPFLGNCLRRSWPCIVWYTIALFLAVPVVMLMNVNTYQSQDRKVQNTLMFIDDYQYILIVFCVLISVVCGIVAMRYLMDRRSSYFFHSLPQTRLELYAANVIVQMLGFLFAILINTIITLIIFCSTDVMVAFGPLMVVLAKALMYFLLFYSITLFAGSVAGNMLSQLLMVVYTLAILPACYASIVSIVCNALYFTNATFYTENERIYAALSPVARLGMLERIPLTAVECVTTVTVSLAIMVCAYYICRARAAEKSGTPIVFGGLGEFVKISSLFPITYFFGFVFKLIAFGGEGWRFFGFIVGALLGNMAFNLVLYLNPRRMLAGWKKLVVFFGCFILTWCLLGYGVFTNAADRYVPDADKVTEVQIGIRGESCNFKDKAVIAAAVEAARKNIDLYSYVKTEFGSALGLPAADISKGGSEAGVYVNFTFYTKSGADVSKAFWCHDVESINALRWMIAECDEYKYRYVEALEGLGDSGVEVYVEMLSLFETGESGVFRVDGARMASEMISDIKSDTSRHASPIIGVFGARVEYNGKKEYHQFEIRLCDEHTLSYIASMKGMTHSEYMEYIRDLLSDRLVSVTVFRSSDNKKALFDDPQEVLEIVYSAYDLGVAYDKYGLIPEIEDDYNLVIGYLPYGIEPSEDGKYDSHYSVFLLDQIPDFVKAKFEE